MDQQNNKKSKDSLKSKDIEVCKVVFLGPTLVGKTRIIQQFIDGYFNDIITLLDRVQ